MRVHFDVALLSILFCSAAAQTPSVTLDLSLPSLPLDASNGLRISNDL
jgi:hypothetical protein